RLDDLIDPAALHIRDKPRRVHAKLARIGNKSYARIREILPGVLISVKTVVHLPEFALHASRLSRMCGGQSVLVHLCQRKVMKDKTHLVTVLGFNLFQFRKQHPARWALIVAIFFQNYRRTDFYIRPGQSGVAGWRLRSSCRRCCGTWLGRAHERAVAVTVTSLL